MEFQSSNLAKTEAYMLTAFCQAQRIILEEVLYNMIYGNWKA